MKKTMVLLLSAALAAPAIIQPGFAQDDKKAEEKHRPTRAEKREQRREAARERREATRERREKQNEAREARRNRNKSGAPEAEEK